MDFKFSGRTVELRNNVLIVDGRKIDLDKETSDKQIMITFEGNVEKVDVDVCSKIEVRGVTGSVQTTNGDIDCGDIGGSVSTVNGDVSAKTINGSVSTVNGDIER